MCAVAAVSAPQQRARHVNAIRPRRNFAFTIGECDFVAEDISRFEKTRTSTMREAMSGGPKLDTNPNAQHFRGAGSAPLTPKRHSHLASFRAGQTLKASAQQRAHDKFGCNLHDVQLPISVAREPPPHGPRLTSVSGHLWCTRARNRFRTERSWPQKRSNAAPGTRTMCANSRNWRGRRCPPPSSRAISSARSAPSGRRR